ncbi:MAG: flippase-like domain-containing protein [candidate division Zixibacteria bacterium]|nr:flippase-like domain-containing protein [candidate division Zixibacteria bacterium]
MALLKRKRFWGAILALILIIFLFRDFKFKEIWNIIISINFWYLIPLCIAEFLIAFVRSQRWKYIIDPGKKISSLDIFSTFSIGMMMNLLLPALTGQVARIFLLAKKESMKKTFAFTTVVLEVLFDAIVLFGLLLFVSTFYVFPDYISGWWPIGGLAVAALAGWLYWLSRNYKAAAEKIENGSFNEVKGFAERLLYLKTTFIYGLQMLHSSKHLFLVTGFTIISWSFQAIMVYLLIGAFSLNIDLWGAVIIMIINTIMVLIVVTPVNIGTFQLACVFALSLFGIDKHTALSFSIVLHAFNYIPPVLLGWFFSVKEGLSFKKLYNERAQKDSDEIEIEEIKIREPIR